MPAQYVRAYVYSEIDESDVSYFLFYNLRVSLRFSITDKWPSKGIFSNIQINPM